jgi:ribosome-associated translation inhibitor RaiA
MAPQARAQHSTDVTSGLILHTAGPVPGEARDQVRELVNQLIEMAPRPIRQAKVKIKSDRNREMAERTLAQASLEVSGVTIRAESAGEDPSQALDSLVASLEEKLNHLDDPGASSRQSDRPHFVELEPDQRVIARQKTCSRTEQIDTDQAIDRLAEMSYRFFIYTDIADSKTTVVAEAGEDETTIQKVDGSFPDGSQRSGVRAIVGPPPIRSVPDAVGELNETGRDHLFFRDLDSEKASVLYRRYDGHYGLLVESSVPGVDPLD